MQQLDSEQLAFVFGSEHFDYSERFVDEAIQFYSAAKIEDRLTISEVTLQKLRDELCRLLQIRVFERCTQIPFLPPCKPLTQLSEEELEQMCHQMALGEPKSLEQKTSFRFISEQDAEFYSAANAEVMRLIAQRQQLEHDMALRIAYVLQIVEHFLSVEPTPWKQKLVADFFFPTLAYIAHQQFAHQPQERGRFRYFFGQNIPKLRVTLLKILAQLNDKCPCSWDLSRLFGVLQLFALGYMGDGEAVGAKEVSTMGLKWSTEFCCENVEFLKRMQ